MTALRKRYDTAGLLVLRVVVGVIMAAHGLLDSLGVPAPGFMGYVVTFAELGGGILLILGLLTRLAAVVLTVDLLVALLLVKVRVGLIAEEGAGAGAELDLALIAGLVALLLMGAGTLSVDRLIGLERASGGGSPAEGPRRGAPS